VFDNKVSMSSFVQRYRHQLTAGSAMTVGIGLLIYGLITKDVKTIVSGGTLIALSLFHIFKMLRMRQPSIVTTQSTI
jgi:hypothetical protein